MKQPIGKKLFKLFCQTRPDLQNSIFLLDALVQPVKITQKIHFKYLKCRITGTIHISFLLPDTPHTFCTAVRIWKMFSF